MLLNTRNKRIIFEIVMLIIWSIALVSYISCGSLVLAIISFLVVIELVLKLWKNLKERE